MHMRRCSTCLVIMQKQIKTTMICNKTPTILPSNPTVRDFLILDKPVHTYIYMQMFIAVLFTISQTSKNQNVLQLVRG